MQGRDRGLDLVWPRPRHPERAVQERTSLANLAPIPTVAVLLAEQDELSARAHPGVAARVVEEHEGEDPDRFRLVRHQAHEDPAQADRLRRELGPNEAVAGARAVALVED